MSRQLRQKFYLHGAPHWYNFSKVSSVGILHSGGRGWRRLIGSPKLRIIFHKRATKYRSLLRKMTYKNKGSYESSPPYISEQPFENVDLIGAPHWYNFWNVSCTVLLHIECISEQPFENFHLRAVHHWLAATGQPWWHPEKKIFSKVISLVIWVS